MKKTILSLLLGMACASAFAGVIHFDDLSGDGTETIAAGYQGLNWENVGTIAESVLPDSGYAAGTVSHANTAFNWDGGTVTISKAGAGTFDFVGAFFTSAWYDQEISFEGSRDGQLLYSTGIAYAIDTLTPLWIQLDWSDIDTLAIYNSSGTQWAMDDVNVSVDVPEPASTALFGTALAGLMLARRPKRSA